ncbi:hypothetical protein EVAR_72684_1 [Eumeta japonica]|uniref:Uncharacterized protein n=1 Tax=Eumeta variegata TaxID=151549 RepID=A0A4C1SH69_EUMVA|nr:hypothetical protein EVAR_72684_1 [Eumeta japonica]
MLERCEQRGIGPRAGGGRGGRGGDKSPRAPPPLRRSEFNWAQIDRIENGGISGVRSPVTASCAGARFTLAARRCRCHRPSDDPLTRLWVIFIMVTRQTCKGD